MGLLDSILGGFNTGTGRSPTDRMISTAPPITAPNIEALDLPPGEVGGQRPGVLAAVPAAVIDEATRKAAQADRDGTLAQARDAVKRDPGKRAAIIARLGQLGITV